MISLQQLDSSSQQQVIQSVTSSIRLSLSPWNSRNLLSSLLSSLRQKLDRVRWGEALAKLAEEDPTFRAHTDQETGQTIIAGMGELHLEIIVDRLLREFKVEANVRCSSGCLQRDIYKAC